MVLSLPELHILVDSDSMVIYHSLAHNYLLVEWRGQHDSESARLGCQQLLQAVYETGAKRLLNDSSEAFGEWKDITTWIGAVFVPQLQHAGIESIAWVNAMDWPARNCVASSLHYISRPFVASFDFDQLEEARHWLLAADK